MLYSSGESGRIWPTGILLRLRDLDFTWCVKIKSRLDHTNGVSSFHADWKGLTFSFIFIYKLKGLEYLHQSPLKSVGDLKSSSCLVDGRWVLKINKYGLHSFYHGQKVKQTFKY